MNELIQIVDAYLDNQIESTSLMISGQWGCGKTHFFKNTLRPWIEKKVTRQASGEDKHIRTAYISLYGLTNISDIDREIVYAVHPWLNHKANKIIRGLVDMATDTVDMAANAETKKVLQIVNHLFKKTDKIKLVDWMSLDNTVLCFDDLERCSISVADTLGYINNYAEHKNVKTIVICNEEEIRKEEQNNYNSMKEKVVGKTVKFKTNESEVFSSILNELHGIMRYRTTDEADVLKSISNGSSSTPNNILFIEFIERNKQLIIDLFQRSKKLNIRSLKKSLTNLQQVLNALNDDGKYNASKDSQLINLIVPVTFEYAADERSVKDLREIATVNSVWARTAVSAMRREQSEKPPKLSFREIFLDKYFDLLSDDLISSPVFVSSKAIFDLIVHGYLDKAALILGHTPVPKPSKNISAIDDACSAVCSALGDMENDQFQTHIKTVLTAIQNHQISNLFALFRLFQALSYYADEGVISIKREEVEQILRKNATLYLESGKMKYEDDFSATLIAPGIDEATSKFRDFLIDLNNSLKTATEEKDCLEYFSLLESNKTDDFSPIYTRFLHVPMLKYVKGNRVVDVFHKMSNSKKQKFLFAIGKRFRYPITKIILDQEVDEWKFIQSQLTTWINHQKNPRDISYLCVKDLQKIVSSAMDSRQV